MTSVSSNPERIHADQNRRFIREPPLLENIQVAECHARIVNLMAPSPIAGVSINSPF